MNEMISSKVYIFSPSIFQSTTVGVLKKFLSVPWTAVLNSATEY